MVACNKEHIRHCFLLAFQLKKNAAEATETIRCVLSKAATRLV